LLKLARERRFRDLLPPPDDRRFEASGVVVAGRSLWVVFDNTRCVARLPIALDGPGTWVDLPDTAEGFEDIAYSPRSRRFLLLVESVRRGDVYVSAIDEYDSRWRFLQRRTIEGALLRQNKGYEGIACATFRGRELVWALRERSKDPIPHVDLLTPAHDTWRVERSIDLPVSAQFSDYSALAVRGRRMAVLSQEDGKLWVGRLTADGSATDEGVVFDFPRTRTKHKRRYYALEGLAWIDDDRLVLVSDRANRRKYPKRARRRDESIHVFRLPGRTGAQSVGGPKHGSVASSGAGHGSGRSR
jgi:hypothetical protein